MVGPFLLPRRALTCGNSGRIGRMMVDLETEYPDHRVKVDHQGDMAYIRLREPRHFVGRTDLSIKSAGVLADYDEDDRLLGIEVFLHQGKARPESVEQIDRLMDEDWRREVASRGPLLRAWKWLESQWIYLRHMWGPLCWTCSECREQNRWLRSEGYKGKGGRWWLTEKTPDVAADQTP